MDLIQVNLARVQEKISAAAIRSGRRPEDICLIAVTKTIGADNIRRAIDAGAGHIGESRVQEATDKAEHLSCPVTWHMIGHLQRNKAKQAIELFDLIHSVDSLRLAQTIHQRAEEIRRPVDCLVQVNIANEAGKHGLDPQEVVRFLKQLSSLSYLNVRGLMTLGPYTPDPEQTRPIFRRLRTMAKEIEKLGLPRTSMAELSMGMSGDFEVAIEEGSTMVRVGSAIFGERKQHGQ